MIEVVVDQTGDRAEAPDAESAVVAARTMCTDALGSEQLTCTFHLEGVLLLEHVPEAALWAVVV